MVTVQANGQAIAAVLSVVDDEWIVQEGQSRYRLHARFDADLVFARMALQDSGYAAAAPGELPREFVGGGTFLEPDPRLRR